MTDFRYAQFCPLTRAAEILGERWTILILRELFLGSKRFSDLKSALNGVSPSVLAERLSRLEERGIVVRRELPAPAASTVYELAEAGLALRPLLAELTRWGMRFLGAPGPRDSVRPEWLSLGFEVFASTRPSEEIGAKIHVENAGEEIELYVRGGRGGTVVSRDPLPYDVAITAAPIDVMLFASGLADTSPDGPLRFEGDLDVARKIPSLFDFRPEPVPPASGAARATGRREAPGASRGKRRPAARSSGESTAVESSRV